MRTELAEHKNNRDKPLNRLDELKNSRGKRLNRLAGLKNRRDKSLNRPLDALKTGTHNE